MVGLLNGLAALVAVCWWLVFYRLPVNECQMTYMWPTYVPLDGIGGPRSKYAAYLYSDRGQVNLRAVGQSLQRGERRQPVLFVPGSAGDAGQVRSLATVAHHHTNHAGVWKLDFYTIEFQEELSAFHGSLIRRQARYVNDVVAALVARYGVDDVLVVAHSMGGIVARSLALVDNYTAGRVRTIVTLASPHRAPPICLHPTMHAWYERLRRHEASLPADDDVVLVSIGGGNRDTLVAAPLTYVDVGVAGRHRLNALTPYMPAVGASADHLCILWCNQLVRRIVPALFAVVALEPGVGREPASRLAALRAHLVHDDDGVAADLAALRQRTEARDRAARARKRHLERRPPDVVEHIYGIVVEAVAAAYDVSLNPDALWLTVFRTYVLLYWPALAAALAAAAAAVVAAWLSRSTKTTSPTWLECVSLAWRWGLVAVLLAAGLAQTVPVLGRRAWHPAYRDGIRHPYDVSGRGDGGAPDAAARLGHPWTSAGALEAAGGDESLLRFDHGRLVHVPVVVLAPTAYAVALVIVHAAGWAAAFVYDVVVMRVVWGVLVCQVLARVYNGAGVLCRRCPCCRRGDAAPAATRDETGGCWRALRAGGLAAWHWTGPRWSATDGAGDSLRVARLRLFAYLMLASAAVSSSLCIVAGLALLLARGVQRRHAARFVSAVDPSDRAVSATLSSAGPPVAAVESTSSVVVPATPELVWFVFYATTLLTGALQLFVVLNDLRWAWRGTDTLDARNRIEDPLAWPMASFAAHVAWLVVHRRASPASSLPFSPLPATRIVRWAVAGAMAAIFFASLFFALWHPHRVIVGALVTASVCVLDALLAAPKRRGEKEKTS